VNGIFYHSSQSGGGPPGPIGPKGDTGDRGPGVLNWRGDWNVSTDYEVNDAVQHEGSAYICIEDHTGSEPPSSKWNLLASRGDQGIPGIQGGKGDKGDRGDRGDRGPQGVPGQQGLQGVAGPRGWQGENGDQGDRGDPGIIWRGEWSGLAHYVPGDAVQHDGSCYLAVADNTGSEPPSVNWGLMAAKGEQGEPGAQGNDGTPGLNWKGEWNDITAYVPNDVVFSDGSSYVAVAAITNNQPPSDKWNLVAQKGSGGGGGGTNWRGAWSGSTAYAVGDGVTHNGTSYVCTTAHTNHEPPNASYWDVLAAKGDPGDPGVNWRGAWSGSTAYAVSDGVTHNGTSYVCTTAHTNHEPPNASYWDVLAAGGSGGLDEQLVNGESVSITICQAVYIGGVSTCRLARANALSTSRPVGLVKDTTIAAGAAGAVTTNGIVTATTAQWDAVTGGSGGLTPGAVYYLSSATAGNITSTPPSADDSFVCQLGVALSATKLSMQVGSVIQL